VAAASSIFAACQPGSNSAVTVSLSRVLAEAYVHLLMDFQWKPHAWIRLGEHMLKNLNLDSFECDRQGIMDPVSSPVFVRIFRTHCFGIWCVVAS